MYFSAKLNLNTHTHTHRHKLAGWLAANLTSCQLERNCLWKELLLMLIKKLLYLSALTQTKSTKHNHYHYQNWEGRLRKVLVCVCCLAGPKSTRAHPLCSMAMQLEISHLKLAQTWGCCRSGAIVCVASVSISVSISISAKVVGCTWAGRFSMIYGFLWDELEMRTPHYYAQK